MTISSITSSTSRVFQSKRDNSPIFIGESIKILQVPYMLIHSNVVIFSRAIVQTVIQDHFSSQNIIELALLTSKLISKPKPIPFLVFLYAKKMTY